MATKAVKKKIRKNIPKGRFYIYSSYNNIIVAFTDPKGNVLVQSSAGANGFKGPKKSTPYAAQVSTKTAAEKVKLFGLETVDVYVKGVGAGREQAIRALQSNGIDISSIKDVTPIPHGGCRQKKARRV